MPILFLILAVPLSLAPYWTHQIYLETFEIERAQIAVDNAAIRIGQMDRAALNGLVAANRLVQSLEMLHHPIHLCAQLPVPPPVCVAKDRALDLLIKNIHKKAFHYANAQWGANRLLALAELSNLGTHPCRFERPRSLPIRAWTCPVCQMQTQWRLGSAGKPLQYYLQACIAHSAAPIFSQTKLHGSAMMLTKWDYSLELP